MEIKSQKLNQIKGHGISEKYQAELMGKKISFWEREIWIQIALVAKGW